MIAGGPRRDQLTGRLASLPVVAGAVFIGVLGVKLTQIGAQLRANSDVAAVLLVGHSLAKGTAGRPIESGQPAYVWLAAALDGLGHQKGIWAVLPLALAWLGLLGVVLAVRRVAGGWAAGLAFAIGVAAAPVVLLTEVAPAFHGMAWCTACLLGWYVVAMAARPLRGGRAIALCVGVGLLAGVVAASDALVIPAALVPVAAVSALLYLRTRHRDVLVLPSVLGAAALVSFAAVHAFMASAGYSTGLGGGSRRGLGLQSVTANARVVGRGLVDMAGGLPTGSRSWHSGLALAVAFALLAAAAAGVGLVLLRTVREQRISPQGLARQAHVAYWSSSGALLLATLLLSNLVMPGGGSPPADRLISSERYLTGVFFAVVALVPLWPHTRGGRLLAAGLATVFIAFSTVRLVSAVSNADFQPSASRSLPALAQALHDRGLSRGYASYWDADVLRLSSGGSLDVLPAAEGLQCGSGDPMAVCRDLLNSAGGWFTPHPGRSFVVVDPSDTFIPAPPPSSLGPAVDYFTVDRFAVVVFDSDVLQHFARTCAGRADHSCAG